MEEMDTNHQWSAGPEFRGSAAGRAFRPTGAQKARRSRPPLIWGCAYESSRRGYVLIVVLFVLALAAVATTGICRMSLEKAVQASRAETELRQRWAVVTCRAVLLPKAEDLFLHSGNSVNEIRRDMVLNGHPITLVFGDEQAKANINLMYAQSGLSGAEQAVRTIAGMSPGPTHVELRPIRGVGLAFGSPDAGDDDPRAFESFGQVFPHQLPDGLVTPAKYLTCWGDGSLNFRRASDESVRAVLNRHLPAAEISRLLDARSKDPRASVTELLDGLEMPAARCEKVEEILTEESTCHSLWIISDSGDRIQYDLAVSEGAAMTLFSW